MGAHGPRRRPALGAHLTDDTRDGPGADRSGGFYGRRKGKRLRRTQDELVRTLLPRLRIDPNDPLNAFDKPISSVWLEIGFGGGEHLAAQARAYPEVGFIGCEPFVNGVAKLLAVVERDNIQNVRIWDAEATQLIERLSAKSIAGAYLLYPDPWPKRRHRKRRFISDENLRALARVMPSGSSFRFATDIDDYAGWALVRVMRSDVFRWTAESPVDWRQPWPEWPSTRYEAKALREGRTPTYLSFERI